MSMEFIGGYVFGYVDGEKFAIENNPEQIAAFIVKYRTSNVKIVSILDVMLITTSFGFLDYVADQEYLREKLLPVLVPMQRGEVEPIEFIPYEDDEGVPVLLEKKEVEFQGTKFDVVVTGDPDIIHILELKGPKMVSDVIDSTWRTSLAKFLNLPSESYQLYCYCLDPNVMLEFFLDGENGPLFTRLHEDEWIWFPFYEIMRERE